MLDVTVVIPYFNPGSRLASTVVDLADTLRRVGVTFEVIAVSDGSTDGSDEEIDRLAHEAGGGAEAGWLRMVRFDHNMGKGTALRAGLHLGRGRYLGFIDADGDIPAAQMASFVALVASHQPDVVLGSKRHPMSNVVYPPLRHVYSIAYQLLVRLLFRLNVRDTQTGLKLVRREVLVDVLPRMVEKRFAFDLELLVVARRLGYRKFFEAPVKIVERFSSTISVSSVLRMLVDTLAIFYRLQILHHYDKLGAESAFDGLPVEIDLSTNAKHAGARVDDRADEDDRGSSDHAGDGADLGDGALG